MEGMSSRLVTPLYSLPMSHTRGCSVIVVTGSLIRLRLKRAGCLRTVEGKGAHFDACHQTLWYIIAWVLLVMLQLVHTRNIPTRHILSGDTVGCPVYGSVGNLVLVLGWNCFNLFISPSNSTCVNLVLLSLHVDYKIQHARRSSNPFIFTNWEHYKIHHDGRQWK